MVQEQDEALLNIPEWLRALWIADYGSDTADQMSQAVLAGSDALRPYLFVVTLVHQWNHFGPVTCNIL